jgi:two-component system KDP operon response regulator KdpE
MRLAEISQRHHADVEFALPRLRESRSLEALERELASKTVLVVEDQADLRHMLEVILSGKGAHVIEAADGQDGLRQFFAHQPDLVLLDLMIPEMHGRDVCRQIRHVSDAPIIMLTALHRDEDVIRGLECGADDYVVKPINPNVLLARIRATLRRKTPTSRAKGNGVPSYDDGYLTVDLEGRRVWVREQPIKLSRTEFRLLAYLVRNAGQVLSFQQILDHVWGVGHEGRDEYVHVYISYLRGKLEADPKQPRYLLSERGVGYTFLRQVS